MFNVHISELGWKAGYCGKSNPNPVGQPMPEVNENYSLLRKAALPSS